jgi:hypothetical protein
MTMTLSRASAAWLGLVCLTLGAPLGAQQTVQLAPDGAFPESFSYLGIVREMPDGRVMVADPLGQALVIADLASGTADTLGGVGAGPQEYKQPDRVFALPGDSTLLLDLGNTRLTVIGPDGTFGETYSVSQSEGAGMLLVLPRAVDGDGNPYYLHQAFGPGGPPDSATIRRFDRRTGQSQIIGSVKLPAVEESGGQGRRMLRMVPLSPRDDWAVAPDGRVAIVRAGDYSVEWVHPDGHVVAGPPQEYEPVRVRKAEKQEWLDESGREGVSVGVMMGGGGERSVTLRRGGGGGPARDIDSFEWPDVTPPFRYGRAVVSPDGALWVERYVPAGTDPMIDVFDGEGHKVGAITLPAARRVVGFGDGTVYLARTDEYDLQWLERYRLK